jgi:heat shock protein HtpX
MDAVVDLVELEKPGISNKVEAGLIIGLIASMFAGLGFLISGFQTVHWGVVIGVAFVSVFFFRGPLAVLRRYRVKELDDAKYPGVRGCVARLSERAGLEAIPDVKMTTRDECDVFSVQTPNKATIVVGTAVLDYLEERLLEGVLAHEISHIKNRDTAVMGIADVLVRMTRTMSHLGLVLLLMGGVLELLWDSEMPWGFVSTLIFAPFVAKGLLALLGRARELRADRDAAKLTGDPMALAEALVEFDDKARPNKKRGILRALNPYGIAPAPSDIRNHPATEVRVSRLEKLAEA